MLMKVDQIRAMRGRLERREIRRGERLEWEKKDECKKKRKLGSLTECQFQLQAKHTIRH